MGYIEPNGPCETTPNVVKKRGNGKVVDSTISTESIVTKERVWEDVAYSVIKRTWKNER